MSAFINHKQMRTAMRTAMRNPMPSAMRTGMRNPMPSSCSCSSNHNHKNPPTDRTLKVTRRAHPTLGRSVGEES